MKHCACTPYGCGLSTASEAPKAKGLFVSRWNHAPQVTARFPDTFVVRSSRARHGRPEAPAAAQREEGVGHHPVHPQESHFGVPTRTHVPQTQTHTHHFPGFVAVAVPIDAPIWSQKIVTTTTKDTF